MIIRRCDLVSNLRPAEDFRVDVIVLAKQQLFPGEIHLGRQDHLRGLHHTAGNAPQRSDLAGELHIEDGALVQLALHPDLSVQHFHDLFGNGKPETRALDVLGVLSFLSGEGIEKMLAELFAHADARVLHLRVKL